MGQCKPRQILFNEEYDLANLKHSMAFPAFVAIDKYGRRTLCLFSTPILGLCLFAGGFCFQIEAGSTAYYGSLFTLVFIFIAAYPLGKTKPK